MDQPSSRAAFLWQGFDHEWLRTVLGFRLPHRISKLHSFIDDQGRFQFGQATGVDGNYMRPCGFYAALSGPGLRAEPGVSAFSWTDEIEDGEHPIARSSHRAEIPGAGAVVLQGIELDTCCDDAKQPPELPCNSQGMWPCKLRVAIEDGGVAVDIDRAWTPMKGGVPGIEEKPLNRRLDFAVRVHYVRLSGDGLACTPGEAVELRGAARHHRPQMARVEIAGKPGPTAATVGLTEFAFELVQPDNKNARRHGHRGRYIGRLRFHANLASYDAPTGAAAIDHVAQVWIPKTVVATDVTYRMRTALIQLDAGTATEQRTTCGQLCSNSADEAPFFSHWKKCGKRKYGPAQTEDRVALPPVDSR